MPWRAGGSRRSEPSRGRRAHPTLRRDGVQPLLKPRRPGVELRLPPRALGHFPTMEPGAFTVNPPAKALRRLNSSCSYSLSSS
jgi:hypothetical protein